ncbi:MAG TPA: hypothetical protein VIU12_16240 [Chryseolinea sp.]
MSDEANDGLVSTIVTLIDGVGGIVGLPPVLGTVDSVRKLIKANSDQILNEKIEAFFTNYSTLSNETKRQFIEILKDRDKDFIKRTLDVIARLDGVEKATILGILFEATVLGKVHRSEFRRISFMVDRTYITDLEVLYSYYGIPEWNIHLEDNSKERHTQKDLMQLYALGYLLPLETTIDADSSFGSPEVKYELTYIGEKFMDNALRQYFENRDKPKESK